MEVRRLPFHSLYEYRGFLYTVFTLLITTLLELVENVSATMVNWILFSAEYREYLLVIYEKNFLFLFSANIYTVILSCPYKAPCISCKPTS